MQDIEVLEVEPHLKLNQTPLELHSQRRIATTVRFRLEISLSHAACLVSSSRIRHEMAKPLPKSDDEAKDL